MSSSTLGRLSSAEMSQLNLDESSQSFKALLTQQDAIIVALKAIAAKLDADGGVTDTNYASTITASLAALSFKI